MKYSFRNFNKTDYGIVYRFLLELSIENQVHINWNWARWEWMYFHPEFDRDNMEKVGLWFCKEELVGAAIYDYYFGEAFFATKSGFEELEKEILDYMVKNFSDENGLGIAVNDEDSRMIEKLKLYGFCKEEQTENILEISLDAIPQKAEISKGLSFGTIDKELDFLKQHQMLWKGFDHKGELVTDEETIKAQKRMLSALHMNSWLHVVAVNEEKEYVSYCGLWYDKETDYVYVEPVCTIPEYRGKGAARMVVTEALQRAYGLGARKAYVISEMEFYKKLGFQQHSHYTFYWHRG